MESSVRVLGGTPTFAEPTAEPTSRGLCRASQPPPLEVGISKQKEPKFLSESELQHLLGFTYDWREA
jgi:hypothetical protein